MSDIITIEVVDPVYETVTIEVHETNPEQLVPKGGTTGQVLAKQSDDDYNADWTDNPVPPVNSVNGQTGTVVLDASDVGAYPDSNPSGYVDATGAAAAAPIQSVTGDGVGGTPADVVLTFPTAGEIGAEADWVVTTDNTGTLTGKNVIWLADTTSARNRTLDVNGERLQVKDVTGSAGTNNITLTAAAGQTINGNATETIDVNYGWVEYVRVGTNWVTIGGQA